MAFIELEAAGFDREGNHRNRRRRASFIIICSLSLSKRCYWHCCNSVGLGSEDCTGIRLLRGKVALWTAGGLLWRA
jgi:hypothetical protein